MITRILLTVVLCCFFESPALAADQTLDDITTELKAKKAEMEPFDESKVKVDLESLGLDDVDKPHEAVEEKKEPAVETKVEEKKPEEKKPEEKKTEEVKAEPKAEEKKPDEKYVNAQKKKNLKKNRDKKLVLERQRKEHAKKQADNLAKFNQLRQRYLLELGEDGESLLADEKILPRKKDLNPFIDDEMPALPILNRYRSMENINIPVILTPKERVDLLFATISANDVASFNDAYKDVENPNVQNSFGDTPLTYAMLTRRYAIVASVIAKGADVNRPNKLGYTPVNIAIELLDFKLLEMLANNKADLNYLDAFGRSYLMHASRVGFLPAVDLLVSRGVDVNLMDNDGFTALSIAYRHKKEVVVQYLLKRGAKTWIEKPYDPKSQSLIKELENRWK